MKTDQEFKEKQEKQLAEFRREQALYAELPEGLRDEGLICLHRDHASLLLQKHYPNPGRKLVEALGIVRQFKDKLVECEHWKDGCVSTQPPAINSCAKKERATMDGSHIVEIDVHGGQGYGPTVEIQFWIQLNWGLVEVSVEVTDMWVLVPSVHNTFERGEIVSSTVTWPSEKSVVDSFRKFWSPPGSYQGSYYLADMPNFEAWASNHIAPALTAGAAA